MPEKITPDRIAAAGFETVAEVSPVTRWIEVRTAEQAAVAGALTETAIGIYFKDEFDNCGSPTPHRWFVLLETAGEPIGRVAMCVPDRGMHRARYRVPFHTTGHRNANPHPEFDAEIAILGQAIGLEIPRNYQGHVLTEDELRNPAPRM